MFGAAAMKSAAVVGAGFAGLTAALKLAEAGVVVDVFEACDRPGGRAQRLVSEDGRFTFDMGPTLIVMTQVLRQVLGDESFDALRLRRLEPGYSVRWPSGERFDMHSDIALWLDNVQRFEGRGGAARALDYVARVYEQYLESRDNILAVDFKAASIIGQLLRWRKLRPWALGDLRKFTQKYFANRRVVEALTFQSLYLGLSPQRSPAIYSLLPVVEIVDGLWYPPGGTASIVDAFVGACTARGVRIHYSSPVSNVPLGKRRAVGVVVGGRLHPADAVIIASDREPALTGLLAERPRRSRLRYGHSAMLTYLGISGSVDLPHHSVLLPDDPWAAYRELDEGVVPQRPPVYVCNPSRSDESLAPSGFSTLLILTPVPNRAALHDCDERAVYERAVDILEQHTGPIAGRIVYRRTRGPAQFERELGLAHGAAFGPDHGLGQMGPLRPSIGYSGAPNVAFAGSGTRPGSGVPLVMMSGRLAAERIMQTAG